MKGQLVVRRSVTRRVVSTPKNETSGRSTLGDEAFAVLKGARHLKREFVFCGD